MKKTLTIILSVFLFFITSTMIYAKEDTDETLEQQINSITEDYLLEKECSSIYDLSRDDLLEYLDLINKVRDSNIEVIRSKQQESITPFANSNVYKGYIFVTGDSKTSYVIVHGHAGIGAGTPGAVIEANRDDGVKIYYDRISSYWSKVNSSILGVINATSSNYTTAYNYACSKVGCDYGFDALDSNDFYCSELVHLAWKQANYNIGPAVGLVLPLDLYVSPMVYVTKEYNDGY